MQPSRSNVLAVLAFAAVGLVAACAQPGQEAPAADQARDVSLVEPAAPEAVQVSDLEAGRPTRVAAPKRHAHPPAPAAPTPDAVLSLDRAPVLGTTTVQTAELREAPAPAAAPVEEPVVLVGRGVDPMYSDGGIGIGGSHGGRGPGIIIRGGRGGIDDDCDLHRPGGAIAINRVAQSPSGGVSIIGRSTGAPRLRGGIR